MVDPKKLENVYILVKSRDEIDKVFIELSKLKVLDMNGTYISSTRENFRTYKGLERTNELFIHIERNQYQGYINYRINRDLVDVIEYKDLYQKEFKELEIQW